MTSTLTLIDARARHPRLQKISRRIGSATRWTIHGRADAARWERPALLGLLALTGVLYLWNLGASGWANDFYSAAVQAGSKSWTAFFYGSSDAANSITVDKPPASLWVMEISARIFGLSAWSILVPQALMGVASVGVLYATVRRGFSAATALIAGAVLAVTPVAALMFRFNNPDALLVLLLGLATYFTLRGIESGALRWVLWAGVAVGFGFLTKQLQSFLVLPVLAGVYLAASPRSLRVRFMHLFGALGAVIASAGWWVAIVELVPESWRPYIGGSQTNSFLELTFGYNGLGRLTGDETGSVTGGAGGAGAAAGGMWGTTGLARLFSGEIGGQVTWLLPAALVLGGVGIVLLWKAPRLDARRATLLLFGGTLVITAVAFSLMAGIFHAYYTVALAPVLAGTVAVGASLLWAQRDHLWARIMAAATILGTSLWAWVLLTRAGEWQPSLKFVVLGLGLVAAAMLLLPERGRALSIATLGVTLTAALLAPAAYTLETVATAHSGSIVTAGPSVSGSMGGPGGAGGFRGARPGDGGAAPAGGFGGTPPAGAAPGTGTGTGTGTGAGTGAAGRAAGGFGGLLGGGTASAAVTSLLEAGAESYTWVGAAVGSNSAAIYQLATGDPVMAVGGFNGSDPSPTLQQFTEYVATGQIHYFIGGGSIGAANGGADSSAEIAAWVAENYAAVTVDGVTLYDLTE